MSQIPEDIGKKYISAWKKAAHVLKDARERELPLTDTPKGLLSLLPAFEKCVKEREPSVTSGCYLGLSRTTENFLPISGSMKNIFQAAFDLQEFLI